MSLSGQDTLKCRRTLTVGSKSYDYFSIPEAAKTLGDVSRLPFSLKVLLENLLRYEDGGHTVSVDHIKALNICLGSLLESSGVGQGRLDQNIDGSDLLRQPRSPKQGSPCLSLAGESLRFPELQSEFCNCP